VPTFPFGPIGSGSAVGRHDLSRPPSFLATSSLFAFARGCAAFRRGGNNFAQSREDFMPTFILSLSWTDQGIRAVKDAPKRSQAARDLAKKVGVEIKEVYLTSGDDDLLVIVDTPNGDNVAKFALALGALGNVRTRTARAWPEPEFQKLISELP
jgi:uncharacterized protein with GYD domain